MAEVVTEGKMKGNLGVDREQVRRRGIEKVNVRGGITLTQCDGSTTSPYWTPWESRT